MLYKRQLCMVRLIYVVFGVSILGYILSSSTSGAAASFKWSSLLENGRPNATDTLRSRSGVLRAGVVSDYRTGVIFDVPGGLRSSNKTYGTNWSNSDGSIEIDTLRYTESDCLIHTYHNVKYRKRGQIAVDELNDLGWLLSGLEPSEAWWVKIVYRDGECRGLSVVFSRKLLSDTDIDLMRRITESFRPFTNR